MRTVAKWAAYRSRLTERGDTPRERVIADAQRNISSLLPKSVSYAEVDTFTPNAETPVRRMLAVIGSDNYANKYVCSMPGETIPPGLRIVWSGENWIVSDIDSMADVYQKAMVVRCNYMLKFTNGDGEQVSKHAYIRDVTKYLVGENEKSVMTVGDSRMSVTVVKDSDTEFIKRGTRFLIDDSDASSLVAYEVTKLDRVTGLTGGNGIYKFLVCEVNVRPEDDHETLTPDNSDYSPGAPDATGESGGWF